MVNTLVFVVLPYAALALFLCVTPYRAAANRMDWSAFSTQFLERETLYWGSVPWHYGVLPILLAHLVLLVAPGAAASLLGRPAVLLAVESALLALGLLALLGSVVLLVRRGSARLRRVTRPADLLVLALLVFQAATGVAIALTMKWGAFWYLGTAVPYLRSLLSLDPQVGLLAPLPVLFKVHVAGAFAILGVLPFTKLVHLLFLPVAYLKDPPVLYRWLSVHPRSSGPPRAD